eukprot:CAMPEP_0172492436 /NCGR_PEP_ID=MMETSP1066-20121228/23597_1 /TAXON_ID=671091 /ORGANISM="Coscinodiscus wailesii, Strain CCMP2513" /LENGTH=884 /DNA_ID=CAMNT_0013262073 /DNA_START=217 /DNA_END=2871 /DNA_ORIENTATION=+
MAYLVDGSDGGSFEFSRDPMDINFTTSGEYISTTDGDMGGSSILNEDITKLYYLCQSLANVNSLSQIIPPESRHSSQRDSTSADTGLGSSSQQLATNAETIAMTAQKWDDIRRWIEAHSAPESRDDCTRAAEQHGDTLMTALHFVCMSHDPPLDVVKKLIEFSPESVSWADSKSWIPLHYACAHESSKEVLQELIAAYPDGKKERDRLGRTPLHFKLGDLHLKNVRIADDVVSNAKFTDIVRILSDSGAAEVPDEHTLLPLHYACIFGASAEVVEVLLNAYPESIYWPRANRQTSLHLAMANANKLRSPEVLDCLLRFLHMYKKENGEADGFILNTLNIVDDHNRSALYMLVDQAKRVPHDDVVLQENLSKYLKTYLDHDPPPSTDFLTSLQMLPSWSNYQAVTHPNVQKVLNMKVAKRFPAFILLLDFYMLIMIIISFWYASIEFLENSFGKEMYGKPHKPHSGLLIALYIGSGYFLFRELLQVTSVFLLGRIKTWYSDFTNWIDMALISLVIVFTLDMHCNIFKSNEVSRTGLAFTTMAIWFNLIFFVKSLFVDFAVFVSGVQLVFKRLTAFLLALALILMLFALVFYYLYLANPDKCAPDPKDTGVNCTEPEETFAHCTFSYSLLRVYTMLMGEVSMEDYTDQPFATFVYALFALFVVILLSNVLIAIVTDAYGVIKNERAEMVFWRNRLDFVAEMDAISDGPWKRRMKYCFNPPTEDPNPHSDPFYVAWKELEEVFEYDTTGGQNADNRPKHVQHIETFGNLTGKIVTATVIMPLWIFIGFVTMGLLLPPQIREKILVQKTKTNMRGKNKIIQQVTELRNEVAQLREEVNEKMRRDEWEMAARKNEAEAAQSELIADVMQVKEIMSTLLNLRRLELNNRS